MLRAMTSGGSLALSIFLKPFILFVLFVGAALIARGILWCIPEGRIKRLLLRRVTRDPRR